MFGNSGQPEIFADSNSVMILGPKNHFKHTLYIIRFCSQLWASKEHYQKFSSGEPRSREELLEEDR